MGSPEIQTPREMKMNAAEIQSRLDTLAKAMTAKGLREPEAIYRFASQVQGYIYLKWKDVTKLAESRFASDEYKHFNNMELLEAFDAATAFVAELPSLEEARMTQFMGALGKVIDLGKDNGIEVEFINPLTKMMKKLSDNILTDQRAKA